MAVRTAADANASRNLERLRYLTEHFHSLQGGLTGTLIGVGLFASSIEDRYGDYWPARPHWARLASALAWLALAATFLYLPKYLRRRFGTIEPKSPTNKQFSIFLLVLLVLMLFGAPLGRYVDSIRSEIWSAIPGHAFPFTPPVLFWLALLCLSLRAHLQTEDRYRLRFLSFATLAWAVIAFCALHSSLMLWKVVNTGWLGLSMIAMGLHDHLTLVRLMPNRAAEDNHDGGNDE